jgi:hypothetical protein
MATLQKLMGNKLRGDGRKFYRKHIRSKNWFEPIFINDFHEWFGLNQDYDDEKHGSRDDENWEEWIPPPRPKKIEKIKMYKPIYQTPTPGEYILGNRISEEKWMHFHPEKVYGWSEIEVEVEVEVDE